MSLIHVLDDSQRREFDKPPKFSYSQRKIMFSLPYWAEIELKSMQHDFTKVGFVLQIGYFKASGRFFKTDTFQKDDFEFILKVFRLEMEYTVFKTSYDYLNNHRHHLIILENFGVKPFDAHQKENLYQEAVRLLKKQAHPQSVFYSLASYLRANQIEIPTYSAISTVLTQAMRKRDVELIEIIKQNLSPEIEEIFEKMLSINEDSPEKVYLLTTLRKSRELMKPSAIRANISDYKILKKYYEKMKPLLPFLDISDEMIRYYAQFVLRSQVFQVSRRENKYLMLLCFIVYQFRFLGDILIDTFLRATQQFENATQRACKEVIYQHHLDNQRVTLNNQSTLNEFFDLHEQMMEEMGVLKTVALDTDKTPQEKLDYLTNWVNSEMFSKFQDNPNTLSTLRKRDYIKRDEVYYQILEEKSRILQYRVSDILRYLDLDCKNEALKSALNDFKQKDGNINPEKLEDSFLKKQEKSILKRSKSPVSLYKVMLTQQVASHIKSGQIALKDSFQYQAFENYLIDADIWQKNKQELLKQFHLEWIKDWNSVEQELKERLSKAYQTTFLKINKGQNPFVHKRKDGKPRFTEPTTTNPESQMSWELFPKEATVSIIEVLTTIQEKTNFTGCLPHFSVRNQVSKPDYALFFAAILAYGCNIGLTSMARNSVGISANSLENVVNWHFSLENLQRANDKIMALLSQLKIGELFKKDPAVAHTSSDGQKTLMQVDSIHANYSYKYFGKDKGIVLYAFIDEMHRLFHSLTISSSEREALYVFEGLLQNQIVQSDLHSTDTHGTNGINFALLYLAGIRFIPRIEDFQNQHLYCFEDTVLPKLTDYELKLGKTINTATIEQNWDMVCRVMVSLLSKHCSASTLLKRLGSYEHQHPVLQALKELDKILKTEYLLEYMDDVQLRQMIQKQLNKGENAHKFSRAVAWGNSGELKFAAKEEQLIADGCRRLIQNAIIAWNYLYMTQQIFKATPSERKILIQAIEESSPVRWQHINLHGTFDFSKEALLNALDFDIQELIKFDWNI